MQTHVTIIIATRDRCEALRQTLEALGRISVPANFRVELLVADNCSKDATGDVTRAANLPNMKVSYLYEPKPGKANMLNVAIAATKGDIVVFTDDDVRPVDDWLECLCAPILSGEAQMVAGGVVIAPELRRPWLTGQAAALIGASSDTLDPADPLLALGANCAMSRGVLSKVPCFDAEIGPGTPIGSYEDVLFSFQLKAAGYKIVSAFDVTVEHHFDASRMSRASIMRRLGAEGRSLAYLDYHWEHLDVPRPQISYLKRRLRLAYWRLRHREEASRPEGISDTELHILIDIDYYRQFGEERKRPRLYERHGLEKLSGG